MQVLAFTLGDVPLALPAAEVGAIHEGTPQDWQLAQVLGLRADRGARSVSIPTAGGAAYLSLGRDLRLVELSDEQLVPLPALLGSPPGVAGIVLDLSEGRPGFLLKATALLATRSPEVQPPLPAA